jgi:polyisoprenoid-binding protein YceI
MNGLMNTVVIIFSSVTLTFAQGFKVMASGEQTFNFEGKYGSQTSFFSTTPLEDFTGVSKDVKGKVTFNISDIKTMSGSVSISTASLKTGIDLRDKDLRSDRWLDADNYPEITFVIKKVSDVKVIEDNRLEAKKLLLA